MRWTAAEAREAFAAGRVARLATVDTGGRPHLVPVTFVLTGDVISTAIDHKPKSTRALKRLANIEANPSVALLCDHYGEEWHTLWWARADGIARIEHEGPEADDAVTALMARYTQYRDRPPEGPVIQVDVHRWSGWSFR
jgi:PPOX class probable F420-dependent enzyme